MFLTQPNAGLPVIIIAIVKTMKKLLSLLFAFNFYFLGATTYYSDSGASDPNDVSNWWTNTDNTGSNPANFTTASDEFVIQSGHTYTTTAAWSISAAGQTVTVNGNLTYANASTITNLTINGTGIVTANALTTITGTWTMAASGKYIFNHATAGNSTTTFGGTESFNSASILEFQNFETTDERFANCFDACTGGFPSVIWNIQAGSTNYEWDSTGNTSRTINGDLTISSTASGTVEFISNENDTWIIGGDLSIDGGTAYFHVAASTSNADLTVNGDFSVANGATFDLSPSGSATDITLTFKGNVTVSGTGVFQSTNIAVDTYFDGVSTQTINLSGSNVDLTSFETWTVNASATILLASDIVIPAVSSTVQSFDVNGTVIFGTGSTDGTTSFNVELSTGSSDTGDNFTVASGGTLHVTSVDGLLSSSTTGNVRVGWNNASRIVLNSGGNYHYIGDANQVTGTALPTTISGSFVINNSATSVTLSQNTTIDGVLTLTDGELITTATELLTGGTGATIPAGSTASHVHGPFKQNTSATTAYNFPVGDGGKWKRVQILPDVGTAQNFTVEAHDAAPSNSANLGIGVAIVSSVEEWTITGSASSKIRLYWDANSTVQESNSANLLVVHYTAGNWESKGQNAVDTSNDYIESTSSADYSKHTIGGSNVNALPVELISFSGVVVKNDVEIEWVTAQEINNDYFKIERSEDGLNFKPIGFMQGAGMMDEMVHYSFVDKDLENGTYFYRLKQVDFDGEFEYSEMIAININDVQSLDFMITPSHVASGDIVQLKFGQLYEGFVEMNIHSMNGALVHSEKQQINGESISVQLNSLSPGVYLVQIKANNKVSNGKLYIE